jgi:hypothetical protein
MPDNSDDELLGNPIKTQSENSPNEIIPANDTEVINPNQESENMETHAHDLHKAPGQGWKHYFFEFLMLFLAVFAGFLAENQREHFVEHQREKKFARRLLSDLRQDSIFFETRIRLLEARQEAHTRFLKIMTDPVLATDSAVMRGFVALLTGTSNDYTTATYNQMKTSGSLRYIDNDSLTTSLQKYYDVLLARASRDSEGADKFFTDYIISYMTKHFRFQDFKSGDGSSLHVKLLNRSAESDQELINIMGVWAANCDTQLDLQRPAQKQMLALIKLIKKEYHIG